MIWINCLRLASTQPRVAQPHRYAPVQYPTVANCSKREMYS